MNIIPNKYITFGLTSRVDGDNSVEWETDDFYTENDSLSLFGINFKMYDRTQKFDGGKYTFSYTFMPVYTFKLNELEIVTEDENGDTETASGYSMTDEPQAILDDILGDSGVSGTIDVSGVRTYQSRKTNRLALLVDFAAFMGCAIRPVGDNVTLVYASQTYNISKIFEYSTNFVSGSTTLKFLNEQNLCILPGDKVLWAGMSTEQPVYAVTWNPLETPNTPELTLDSIKYTLEEQNYDDEEDDDEDDEKVPAEDYDLPRRWLSQNTSSIYWIEYKNTTQDFCIMVCRTDLDEVQHTNSSGQKYYWTDNTFKVMTIRQTSYSVYVYQYDQHTYATLKWESRDGTMLPVITLTNIGTDGFVISPTGTENCFLLGNDTAFFEWTADGIKSTGRASVTGVSNTTAADSAPESPQEGDIWMCTAANDPNNPPSAYPAYMYHSGRWLPFGGSGGSVVVNRVDLFTPLDIEYVPEVSLEDAEI